MNFPGMAQMQFAQQPTLSDQLQKLGQALQPAAKYAGQQYRAGQQPPPQGPMPDGTALDAAQPPSLLSALRGMSPFDVTQALRGMTNMGQSVAAMLPGSAALQSAGMLPTVADNPNGS